MIKEKFAVTGMTCSACSSRVEKCVSALPGMDKCEVNLLTGSMQTSYDETILDSGRIIEAVEKAGYGAQSLSGGASSGSASSAQSKNTGSSLQEAMTKARKEMKIRLIGSFIFWIPLMYVSMFHMFREWFGLPVPDFIMNSFHGSENAVTFAFTQFLLLLPILYLNRNYFIHGFQNLWRRSPNMDSLVAVGSAAALIYGIFVIYRLSWGLGHQDMALVENYSMEIYFESAATILTLITLGKYLESRSKAQTSKAIEKLVNLAPKTALLLMPDNSEQEVSIDSVKEGDTVIVKPGAYVPVDGTILSGSSSLDESAVTGESIPVEKTVGDTVISASLNKNGYFQMKAEKTGENTTINQIIRLVEEASSSKAPIAKLADKIAGIFVPSVMAIAFLAFLVWMVSGAGFEFSLSIGISVLVISCPCALGLATPVAIMVGTGKGAENGILIKSGEALETAHAVDTVVLDKTGTITFGKPEVTDIITCGISEEELLAAAVMLEKQSEHPLAEAILQYARLRQVVTSEKLPDAVSPHNTPSDLTAGQDTEQAEDFEALFGRGVRCTWRDFIYYAGNMALMQEENINVSSIKQRFDELSEEGKTVLLFARKPKAISSGGNTDTVTTSSAGKEGGSRILGMIAVADMEKPSSLEAIEQFRKLGIDVVMLTGDNEKTAAAIGRRLHIPHVVAQVLPHQKEEKIRELMDAGHRVAMIGDGINDAPALARADIGIAIGAGTDVAIESADAVLIKNNLMDAVNAILLSRAVIRNIKENLFWAFFYNSIGIPLAAGVLFPAFGLKLNPMFGAAAMSLSSVCVVCNALRLRLFKPLKSRQPELSETIKHRAELEKEKGETAMNDITVMIEGMMCAHCQKHVSDALNALPGVTAEVNLEEKNAVLKTQREISDEEITKAVVDAGYEVTGINR